MNNTPTYNIPGTAQEAAQFLVDVRDYVRNQDMPQGFVQPVKNGTEPYGDGTEVSLINTSYTNFDRQLASLAVPLQVRVERDIAGQENDKIILNSGVTMANIGDAMKRVLQHADVNLDAEETPKTGKSFQGRIRYTEIAVPEQDHKKAKDILNLVVRGNHKNGEELLSDIGKLSQKEHNVEIDSNTQATSLTFAPGAESHSLGDVERDRSHGLLAKLGEVINQFLGKGGQER